MRLRGFCSHLGIPRDVGVIFSTIELFRGGARDRNPILRDARTELESRHSNLRMRCLPRDAK
jgi:hypothetical protein